MISKKGKLIANVGLSAGLSGTFFLILPAVVAVFNFEAIKVIYDLNILLYLLIYFTFFTLCLFLVSIVLNRFNIQKLYAFISLFTLLLIVFPLKKLWFPAEALFYLFFGVLAFFLLRTAMKKRNNLKIYTVVLLAAIAVSTGALYYTLRKESSGLSGPECDLSLGSNNNVFILVADGFTGGVLKHFLDENEELKEIFSGFFYYENAVSPLPQTPAALSFLFSGDSQIIWQYESYRNCLKDVFENSIFTDFIQNNYKVTYSTIFEEALPDKGVEILNCPNVFDYKFSNSVNTFNLFLTSLKRVLPEQLIALVEKNIRPFVFIYFKNKFSITHDLRWLDRWLPLSLKSTSAVERLISDQSVGSDENRLFFFHILAPHDPFFYNKAGFTGQKTSIYDNYAYVINLFVRLINMLKVLDRYDQSAFFFISDHGGYVPRNIENHIKTWDNYQNYNSLFLMKPFYSRGRLKQIDRVVSMYDYRDYIKDCFFNECDATELGDNLPVTLDLYNVEKLVWGSIKNKDLTRFKLRIRDGFNEIVSD